LKIPVKYFLRQFGPTIANTTLPKAGLLKADRPIIDLRKEDHPTYPVPKAIHPATHDVPVMANSVAAYSTFGGHSLISVPYRYTRLGIKLQSLRGVFCRSNLLIFKGLLPWPSAPRGAAGARAGAEKRSQ
jgi:hypothetical protein